MYEKPTTTLKMYVELNDISEENKLAWYFQILAAILAMKKYCNIAHGNLAIDQLYLHKTSETHVNYNIHRVDYVVPTFGFIVTVDGFVDKKGSSKKHFKDLWESTDIFKNVRDIRNIRSVLKKCIKKRENGCTVEEIFKYNPIFHSFVGTEIGRGVPSNYTNETTYDSKSNPTMNRICYRDKIGVLLSHFDKESSSILIRDDDNKISVRTCPNDHIRLVSSSFGPSQETLDRVGNTHFFT